MFNEQEQKLITKFEIKAKQDRYLAFLSKEKTRHKLPDELYHFKDFNWNLFRDISGSESEREIVAAEVSKRKVSTCLLCDHDKRCAEYIPKGSQTLYDPVLANGGTPFIIKPTP